MKNAAFRELATSIRQAGRIRRGEAQPSRRYTFKPADVRSTRATLGKSQSEFARMIGVSVATPAKLGARPPSARWPSPGAAAGRRGQPARGGACTHDLVTARGGVREPHERRLRPVHRRHPECDEMVTRPRHKERTLGPCVYRSGSVTTRRRPHEPAPAPLMASARSDSCSSHSDRILFLGGGLALFALALVLEWRREDDN
jgi:hypothetical protein